MSENKNKEGKENTESEKYLFPYSELRSVQSEMIKEVADALTNQSNLIVHAPTGLGKTAATIAPALNYALENKKKVFFLTSRHTQHTIAIQTLKEIKKKYGINFNATDLIGKKAMCTVPGIEALRNTDFYEYCKKQREDGLCEHYLNTRKENKLTPEAKLALKIIERENPLHIEEFSKLCSSDKLCAYELATMMAKNSEVIVSDYYYIYNSRIRDALFNRIQLELKDCIVIADEGHNLPDRIRKLMSTQLSNYITRRALKEARKINDEQAAAIIAGIQSVLNSLSGGMQNGDEKSISKEEFVKAVEKIGKYEENIDKLEMAAQNVREKEKQSSIGTIAAFLDEWTGPDKGYVRILTQKETRGETVTTLSYKCLDPSTVSKEIIQECSSTIMMSGTLTPTEMYRDVLGFPANTAEKKYPSPFPEKNKLAMIIPETTTKFSLRTAAQYKRIAEICAEITNIVPGNSAVFFPSYYVRDNVYRFFADISLKTTFVEHAEMNKEEKSEFLERFKKYKDNGAVLMGVMSGSYGEGIDLPGDLLKCVVVVGLPLQQPTLETNELIKYYDEKFKKGWEYGYVGPAFSKCLQSAGRCIRSESDRGVVIFLDERYTWQNYFKHFPLDWNIKVTKLYADRIREFFGVRK
jgi:DNA excision repair protein ERCC-2